MHYIAFLYLLISAFAASAAPSAMPNPFPSLPAAVHWADSADKFIWKKSLGAALTGHPYPVNNSSKKYLRGAYLRSAYHRPAYHDLIMAAPPQHINDPKAMGINRAIRRGLY